MRWLLGSAAILTIVFSIWYLSIEHADPATLALEEKLAPVIAACEIAQEELAISSEERSDLSLPPQPDAVSPCWHSIDSVLADVGRLLDGDKEKATRQLAGWGWTRSSFALTDYLPNIPDAGLSRTFFDRLLGPRRNWWDPMPAYGCMRYYQLALDTAPDGSLVKAQAYVANTGFSVCS